MRILFFDSIDRDIFGGLENWIGIVASNFVQRGHDVTVAGRPDSEFLRRIATLDDRIHILDVKISGDFNPFTIKTIKDYLQQNDIEIAFVNFNKDIRLAGLASGWHGRTRVIWRVGLDITKDNFVHKQLTPRLIDGVITPSHDLKKQITHFGYITDEMVTVIHNGTTIKDFPRPNPQAKQALLDKYNLPPDSLIAATVGRFVNHKGHVHLIDAAREIVPKHPDVVFMFLGDGPLEAEHKRRIEQYGLTKHFVFAGMLDDLDPELGGSDMAIHPSIIEPFSNALLECMRAGLPIVATRVGGTAEALTHECEALLVEPSRPDQLAAAIMRYLDAPDLREKLGNAAQKRWREEFTIDTMLDKVERYLAGLLEAEPRK